MTRLSKQKGFSIVEIIIVLLILAILVFALTPAYRSYQMRANRSDAIKSILAIQVAQEKYRIGATTYAPLASIWSGTNSYEGYYRMGVSNNTGTTYTITATGLTSQTADTGCVTLTLTSTNGTATQTPASCWQ